MLLLFFHNCHPKLARALKNNREKIVPCICGYRLGNGTTSACLFVHLFFRLD